MIDLIRLSNEANCMDERDVEKHRRAATVKRTVVHACGERFVRNFYEVRIGRRGYLADAATGSLYDPAGACKTSDLLRMLHD